MGTKQNLIGGLIAGSLEAIIVVTPMETIKVGCVTKELVYIVMFLTF
jgi:hypothetical protein